MKLDMREGEVVIDHVSNDAYVGFVSRDILIPHMLHQPFQHTQE